MGKHDYGKEQGKKPEHLFKVRWKNSKESEDTWEPITHLYGQRICENSLSTFTYSDAQAHAPAICLAHVLISYFVLSDIQ